MTQLKDLLNEILNTYQVEGTLVSSKDENISDILNQIRGIRKVTVLNNITPDDIPQREDTEITKFELKFVSRTNEPYRRVWTKPISTYASNYNLFDISLAPLEDNIFNKVKSQLKVIEAGFHHKAIIAQDFGPYKIDLKNAIKFGGGFDLEANGILVETNKNHKDWYGAIKKLIQNPDVVKTLQENLHNTVKDTYSMDKVTEQRRELYLDLYEKNKIAQNKKETVNA